MHDEAENNEFALRAEIARLKAALSAAVVRIAEEREIAHLASATATREALWKAEIERRKLEVESCKAEVQLAERLAISAHRCAEKDQLCVEKDQLIQRLQSEIHGLEQKVSELLDLSESRRRELEFVMNSRSMAITKPMRTLIDFVRRARR